jgi:hypothetical protein
MLDFLLSKAVFEEDSDEELPEEEDDEEEEDVLTSARSSPVFRSLATSACRRPQEPAASISSHSQSPQKRKAAKPKRNKTGWPQTKTKPRQSRTRVNGGHSNPSSSS